MTIEKKLLGTNPSGGAINVADVFSAYLYTGTGSVQTITNGIDLAGKGGLVWGKHRGFSVGHALFDTERVLDKRLSSNTTGAEVTRSGTISSFNSDGYSTGTGIDLNESGREIVSWTFRKAPKFFDIVTYTGNGVAGLEISHDLGVAPGLIIIKDTGNVSTWRVYHKSLTANFSLILNDTDAAADRVYELNDTEPTSTVFTIGNGSDVNSNGQTHVAYLFADNSSEDAEEQMIKCGSYTGNGSSTGPVIDLGWEPQYVLLKCSSHGGEEWFIYDNMRGIASGTTTTLFANQSSAESTGTAYGMSLTPTGFQMTGTNGGVNGSGKTYIYMAIRAPMMVEPESATDVFAVDTKGSTGDGKTPAFRSPFAADMFMFLNKTNGFIRTTPRLTLRPLDPTTSAADAATNTNYSMDFSNGAADNTSVSTDQLAYLWKRAKGFFDVVAYSGTGVAGRTVAHSLGVVPDMIWVKRRSAVTNWSAYHADVGNNKEAYLDLSNGFGNTSTWNNTTPTDTLFTCNASTSINASGSTYIAYLFASLDGVSKVGSYTGNGSSQTINCGFAAGARFIMIKRTDATGDWFMWDTTRGIVAGNDPHLSLNTTAAEVTSDDSVDPVSSGFGVNQVSATNINVSSGTYIYLAIA